MYGSNTQKKKRSAIMANEHNILIYNGHVEISDTKRTILSENVPHIGHKHAKNRFP